MTDAGDGATARGGTRGNRRRHWSRRGSDGAAQRKAFEEALKNGSAKTASFQHNVAVGDEYKRLQKLLKGKRGGVKTKKNQTRRRSKKRKNRIKKQTRRSKNRKKPTKKQTRRRSKNRKKQTRKRTHKRRKQRGGADDMTMNQAIKNYLHPEDEMLNATIKERTGCNKGELVTEVISVTTGQLLIIGAFGRRASGGVDADPPNYMQHISNIFQIEVPQAPVAAAATGTDATAATAAEPAAAETAAEPAAAETAAAAAAP